MSHSTAIGDSQHGVSRSTAIDRGQPVEFVCSFMDANQPAETLR